ncbi:MAG: A/G-specific adenine glycosylase [Rhodoferax sp.]|nr:A/G-specific adenine glycosylase [Rhodoferax sp.]
MTAFVDGFAASVVAWQKTRGRNDLPWQASQDPYRVWLSEIMLQQTQVVTVRAYFTRFVERFPTVADLAVASLDDVLGLWSGLGYYSRARNLHQCAQDIVALHKGQFPQTAQSLQTLPGIGRSTAAAIASLCFGERVAILDANVRRVVTRLLCFDADPGRTSNERALWDAASKLLPQPEDTRSTMAGYTQGMMDLGAMVCLPKDPRCGECPVQAFCQAQAQGSQHNYPVRKRKIKRSSESIWLLWLRTDSGLVWLSKRPTPGVWAGLHCLPLHTSLYELTRQVPDPLRQELHALPAFTHVLTHKDLDLHPLCLTVQDTTSCWGEGRWVGLSELARLGLPAPIRKLLLKSPEFPGAA